MTKYDFDQTELRSSSSLGGNLVNFRKEAWSGLGQAQKTLPSKFFYDEIGSSLFEKITRLVQYYPTRVETSLLASHSTEIASFMTPATTLVEFGAGSLKKIRILLAAMHRPETYVPIDISKKHLIDSANHLAAEFPHIEVQPVVADFSGSLDISMPISANGVKRVGFFSGSTIGNFSRNDAVKLLKKFGRVLGSGGELLIGVDLKKDERILLDAYNDSEGVTAEFNLNLLVRINRELGGNFDLNTFDHKALYNADEGRI